jgi:DNA invertase Pin-like site-specific DNA recombinase
MLERQREGIAEAKVEGKYEGRARTAMAKAGEVEKLLAAGVSPTGDLRGRVGCLQLPMG